VEAGVTTDIDGDPRSYGEWPDVGADEYVAPVAPTGIIIGGPTEGIVGESYVFTATVSPPTATLPLTYTWSPIPDSGQGTETATYNWATPGPKTISVTVENVAGAAPPGTHDIVIAEYKVSAAYPEVTRRAGVAGVIVYRSQGATDEERING